MNVNELINNINKGKIENIYLFAGSEIGEKNEILKLIETKLFADSKPVKYTFYCANEFEPGEFIDVLSSGLLFSEKKIVILRNIEQANKSVINIIENLVVPKRFKKDDFENKILSKINSEEKIKAIKSFYKQDENGNFLLKEGIKDSDLKKLISLIESSNYKNYDENTYLIMLNETNERIPLALLNLLTQNQHIIFWEMYENQKSAWVRMEFKKYDLFIDDDGIEFILDTVENNRLQLENEIGNIAISYDSLKNNDKRVVTREIIEEFLYHSKEESAFTLYSAMLEKNLQKSLEILDKIFITEEDSILTGIVWSHRRFLKALDLYENQNFSPEEIFTQLVISVKKVKEEFVTGFKIFSFFEMSMMCYYLSELDYYLKVLPQELKLVKLQEFIINFIYGDIKKSFLKGQIVTGHFDNFTL